MSKSVFIFFGSAGSGKTTFAKEFANKVGAGFYDGDDSYTPKLRDKRHKSDEMYNEVMGKVYENILSRTKNIYSNKSRTCVSHTFTQNKYKQMFINEFGRNLLFIFVRASKKKQLDLLYKREKKDPKNKNRDPEDLKEVLRKKIDSSDSRREYPDNYVVVRNKFDQDSLNSMEYFLMNFI